MNCHACGTQLASTARFCHKCGAALQGAQAAGWRAGLPWAIAGVAVGALITVVGMRLTAGTSAGRPPQDANPSQDAGQPPMIGGGPGTGRPPDISRMSPE